jgi:SAM-dependent methyltransferase
MDSLRKNQPAAEFDAYAAEYDAGMDNPLKKCLGSDAVSFIEVKADWLLRAMRRRPQLDPARPETRLLDYGCGAGTLLSVLRQRAYAGFLAGCDVSAEMLAEARRRWSLGPQPQLSVIENGQAPFDAAQFDLVVVSAVLHHVERSSRPVVYRDVLRLLKPGGCVCIFEHNPYNPLTQWVVRHTAIDKNATLLRPAEVRAGLTGAGATRSETHYLMFSPPNWKICRPLDRSLSWLPLGAQYAVFATE